MLVVLGYVVAAAVAFVVIKFVVLPAIHKGDNSSGSGGGTSGPKDPTQLP